MTGRRASSSFIVRTTAILRYWNRPISASMSSVGLLCACSLPWPTSSFTDRRPTWDVLARIVPELEKQQCWVGRQFSLILLQPCALLTLCFFLLSFLFSSRLDVPVRYGGHHKIGCLSPDLFSNVKAEVKNGGKILSLDIWTGRRDF